MAKTFRVHLTLSLVLLLTRKNAFSQPSKTVWNGVYTEAQAERGNASEPARTKDPASSKDEELRSIQSKTLGTQKLLLMNVYPSPDAYKSHKVETKGFLIREPNETRLNVTSLQSLAPDCEPAG